MPKTTPLIKAALNLREGAGFDVYLAEILDRAYSCYRWISKSAETYSVNSKRTKPPELHTIMKECNGTGLVLKICETKNVWKRYWVSIRNGIDNYTKITKIKLDSASLNNVQEPRNAELTAFLGSRLVA